MVNEKVKKTIVTVVGMVISTTLEERSKGTRSGVHLGKNSSSL